MVQMHQDEFAPFWVAIDSIAPKIGRIPSALYEWVRGQEINTGLHECLTREERNSVKAHQREVNELRCARAKKMPRCWYKVSNIIANLKIR